MRPAAYIACAAIALQALACTTKEDATVIDDGLVYLTAPVGDRIVFSVDSTVFDPAAGATARLDSRSLWMTGDSTTDYFVAPTVYRVDIRDSTGTESASLLWSWEVQDNGLIAGLDGISTLGIVAPVTLGLRWDPLLYDDPSRELSVAGEPVAALKNWGARVDSIADYTLWDGTIATAAYVTLADAENLLELRQVREVYVEGLGLVERDMRIFDTQQTASRDPWEEKAERGYAIKLRRIE